MKFNMYLKEAELRSNQPVTGDVVTINVNDMLSIRSTVVEHTDGSITLDIDSKSLKILKECGCAKGENELDESQDQIYTAPRDVDIVRGTDYKGFVMGDMSEEDGETRKRLYAVFQPMGGNQYKFVSFLTDPRTGQSPSPYGGVDYKVLYQKTVDRLPQTEPTQLELPGVSEAMHYNSKDIDTKNRNRLDGYDLEKLAYSAAQSGPEYWPTAVNYFNSAIKMAKSSHDVEHLTRYRDRVLKKIADQKNASGIAKEDNVLKVYSKETDGSLDKIGAGSLKMNESKWEYHIISKKPVSRII